MEIKTICLNIVILVFLNLHLIDCSDKIPQIKVVGTQIVSLNPQYNDALVYTINRVNETFNHLSIYWSLKEDPPADTMVFIKVYVTDSTYQNGTLALDLFTPICKADKNHELLPNIIQVPESAFNTQCLKKGVYHVDFLELYRFEVLLPDIENLGKYYRIEYTFSNGKIILGSVIVYSEWGYLNPK